MSSIPSVMITGVSSGIGYDAARFLLGAGYRVFGSVRKPDDKKRLESSFPERFHCVLFDMEDQKGILAAAEQIQTTLGDTLLTGLINNAGYALPGPLQLVDDNQFEKQMRVNLLGTRYVTNAFLAMLGATHDRLNGHRSNNTPPGKIINISSLSGVLNTPINGSYCIAKHALESLGEVYRRELYMYGIDVVSIQPGPIQSKIWEKNIDSMEEFSSSDYGLIIKKSNAIMRTARRHALPAEVVSRLILKILCSRYPRTQYIVHSQKWLPGLLAHWVPDRLMDYLIHRKLSSSSENRGE